MSEMRRRISDHDIERLLTGKSPGDQPELLAVAEALGAARTAAYESAPQPSAALAARLDLSDEVSAAGRGEPVAYTHSRGNITMRDRIAGFGLAARISAGVGVLALGFTGVGAAGALPGPVQSAFDTAVETVLPQIETEVPVDGDGTGEIVDETLPVGSKEFSSWVREGAQDPDKVGSEFGAAVSEQARELREEKAAERAAERAEAGKPPIGKPSADDATDDISDDATNDASEEATETSGDADKPGNGNGKPEKPRNENAQGGKP